MHNATMSIDSATFLGWGRASQTRLCHHCLKLNKTLTGRYSHCLIKVDSMQRRRLTADSFHSTDIPLSSI